MTLKDALEAALAAVDRGAVSAEDALRSVVAGRRPFTAWVERNASRWESGLARRPAVRRGRRYPAGLVRAAIAKAGKAFAALPGVVSVHWGLVRVHGRSTSDQGVVVAVRSGALGARAGVEATSLRVRYGKRFRRVRVNVQPVPEAGAPQGARPGRHASVEVGNHRGALGALVDRGGELHAILSGHVAQAEGAEVVAVAVDGTRVPLGTVRRVVIGSGGDEARAGPVAAPDASRVATGDVTVRELTSNDVNVALLHPPRARRRAAEGVRLRRRRHGAVRLRGRAARRPRAHRHEPRRDDRRTRATATRSSSPPT